MNQTEGMCQVAPVAMETADVILVDNNPQIILHLTEISVVRHRAVDVARVIALGTIAYVNKAEQSIP